MTHDGRGAPEGATAIVTALAEAGTTVVFGLPGGGPNLDVVGAAEAAGLRFVLTHTETAAVIMAATYADLSGRPGAAVVTRGPGLASAVNGIAHAALDRLPVVVIADTVRAADAGRISHQRLDHAGLGRAVAKAVVTIGRDRTSAAAAAAVRLAATAPAGPVVALMDDSGVSDLGGGPGPVSDRPEWPERPERPEQAAEKAALGLSGAAVARPGFLSPATSHWPSRPGNGGNSPSAATCWPAAAPSATARSSLARSDLGTRGSSSGCTALGTNPAQLRIARPAH